MMTVIEEARKMAAAKVLRLLALRHGGEQGWMREAVASILCGEQDAHPEVLTFIAAIELGERRADAAVVGCPHCARPLVFHGPKQGASCDNCELHFAAFERRDHRSKP